MSSDSYYVRSRGKVSGPHTLDQLRGMRDRGQFGRFHEISGDRSYWAPASTLTELFSPPAAIPSPAAQQPAPASTPELPILTPTAPPAPASTPELPILVTATPLPAVAWFYSDAANRQQGPVSWEALVQLRGTGQVTQDTPVWREGFAGSVPFSSLAPSAPAQTPEQLGWSHARLSSSLLLAAMLAFFSAIILFGLACATLNTIHRQALRGGSTPRDLTQVPTLLVLALVVQLLSLFLDAAGCGYWVKTNPSSRSKVLSIASSVLALIQVAGELALLLGAQNLGQVGLNLVVMLVLLIHLGRPLLLPLFLKDRLLGPHAARTLQQLTRGLRWQTAVVIAGILLSLVAFVSGNSFALVVFVLVALMDLGMRAWFAVLLFEVRAAFTAAMAPRP